MKTRYLVWLSGGLFLLAHLLPAYLDLRGFKCFSHCLNILWRPADDTPVLGWLYYSGFVLTNLAFVAVWITGLVSRSYLKTRFIVSALAFFQVASWLLLNLRKESDSDSFPIQAGYYVWLLAYALLLASQVLETRKPSKT